VYEDLCKMNTFIPILYVGLGLEILVMMYLDLNRYVWILGEESIMHSRRDGALSTK